MQMMRVILLSAILIFSGNIYGQNGNIKGKITNQHEDDVEAATISIDSNYITTLSDKDGNYQFKNITPGDHIITISCIGYRSLNQKINVVANKTQSFNFLLNTNKTNLEEVTVNGKYYKKYRVSDLSSSLRLQTPLLQTPQNISVITNAALINQQVLTMGDAVVRNVSGATRMEHWGEMYTRINMRGFRAGAFYNGVNVSSQWGPLSEDMSYVDRIEFVKGPAGFMMSNGEPSGIYNVVTKKPTGRKLNGSVRMMTGSYSLFRADADIDGSINKNLSLRLNLMGQKANSFRQYDFQNRYVVAPSLRYNFSKKTQLTAEYIYQKYKTHEVGSAYIFNTTGYKIKPQSYSMSDPGIAPTTITEQNSNINLKHSISDNWQLTSQITYLYSYMLGSDMWGKQVTPQNFVQRYISLWESKNSQIFGQVFLNGRFNTGNVLHKTLVGLDVGSKKYLADWSQSHILDKDNALFDINATSYQKPSNGYPKFDLSKPLEERANPSGSILQDYTGLYAQDELGFLSDKIRLTLAARLTDVKQSAYGGAEQKATKITPRIGVSIDIAKNFAGYALYDQSFLPQTGFLRDGGKVKPITGNNIEIGLKKDWMNGRWNTVLAVYQITKRNELINDPNNAPTEKYSIVKGESVAKGIEFDLKGEIANGLNMIFNYAFIDNSITKSNVTQLVVGSKVAGYAKHTVNGWLNYAVENGALKGTGVSAGFTYLKDRSSWVPWRAGVPQIEMDDYLKFDSGIFWEKFKTRVTLNVFNLANAYLYSGASYGNFYYYQAEAPRNWRLSVAYKF